jgi:hypothetical protein
MKAFARGILCVRGSCVCNERTTTHSRSSSQKLESLATRVQSQRIEDLCQLNGYISPRRSSTEQWHDDVMSTYPSYYQSRQVFIPHALCQKIQAYAKAVNSFCTLTAPSYNDLSPLSQFFPLTGISRRLHGFQRYFIRPFRTDLCSIDCPAWPPSSIMSSVQSQTPSSAPYNNFTYFSYSVITRLHSSNSAPSCVTVFL